MATRRIREYLDGNHVRYALISHSPAYTASEVAESIHIAGRNMAKVVILVADGRLAMAVVSATRDVDLTHIQQAMGLLDVRLANEAEFVDRFEGCQLGTAPPFGNLFGMETLVDRRLVLQSEIAFNAGTHHDVILMSSDDYVRLARRRVGHIAADPIRESFPAFSL